MKWQFHKRISPITVGIIVLAAIVHLVLHVPLWQAFLFTMLGIVINAIVTTFRDDAAGGCDGSRKEPPSEKS
jgi:hypothetical protein